MNLNEPLLNPTKGRKPAGYDQFKMPVMRPPSRRTPKSKSASSRTSDLPWGKSYDNVLNSSNRPSTSSRSTGEEEDKIVVALTEGRGEARCEVGIAAINVSRPVLILCQTSDSQSYNNTLSKLNILNPHSIVYPDTFDKPGNNRLLTAIRRRFPNKKLLPIPRRGFNKTYGLDRLYKISLSTTFPLLFMIKNRYYTLAAASGLLTYLQDCMFIYYASHSVMIDYQASEGYAIIDIATADRLELVSCNEPLEANKYSSLFGIMNRCLTRVGSRNLRSIILQPLFSQKKIEERLDCVEELIKKPDILLSVQKVLPKLAQVDQLLGLCSLVPEDPHGCSSRQLNYLLLLNSVVDSIVPLGECMKNASQPFFKGLIEVLNDVGFEEIRLLIRECIHEDAYYGKGQHAEQQRIWAIRSGINGLLDLIRKTYSERIEEMREYVKKLGQEHDLPLVLTNNNKKGYHITLTLNQFQKRHMKPSDLPVEFIQVFRLANSFTMKTAKLVNFSTRIDDLLTDLYSLSNLVIHQLILKLRDYAHLFHQLVEMVSYLDVIQSLAEVSYSNSWVRPKFSEFTDVTFSRHPLLDFLLLKKPQSNPIQACEHYNLHLITGPNGAGKSIFIRQVMLLQIMAQAGCYVPAHSAIFRPADKMFARVSNEDDMESNASSFVLEMTEVKYILTTMTDKSLVIIDELCRSTSVEEATAMALMICDYLARSKAYSYVTTHFTLLAKIADLFFNVKVWQLQTLPLEDPTYKSMKLDFKFSLAPGPTTLRGYGIYMARGIWPDDVLSYVDEIQDRCARKSKNPKFPHLSAEARLKYSLQCKLAKLRSLSKFTVSNVNKLLNEYNELLHKEGVQGQMELSHNWQQEGMDHSIFDASCQSQEMAVMDSSRIFLDDIREAVEGQQEEGSQVLIEHPAQSKQRMREVFTPTSQLDQTTYSLHTVDLTYNDLLPEIQLSYNSQCSLNITQKAMDFMNQQPPVAESPFLTQFARDLQNDLGKTSTPVPDNDNETVWRGNVSFTIPKMANVDVNEVVEDLQSFVEELEAEQRVHVYPIVHVKALPEQPSSDDDGVVDEGVVVRPVVKDLRVREPQTRKPPSKVNKSKVLRKKVKKKRHLRRQMLRRKLKAELKETTADVYQTAESSLSQETITYSPMVEEETQPADVTTIKQEEVDQSASTVVNDREATSTSKEPEIEVDKVDQYSKDVEDTEVDKSASRATDVDQPCKEVEDKSTSTLKSTITKEASVEDIFEVPTEEVDIQKEDVHMKQLDERIKTNMARITALQIKFDDPANTSSLSEASKLRNLEADSSGSFKRNLKEFMESGVKKRKKFTAPLKKPKSQCHDDVAVQVAPESSTGYYPAKMSQKAIRESFYEQDRKFFASSDSSTPTELSRMWEERMMRPPRPTPQQIKRTTCLATIRKTNEGVEVIPAEKQRPTKLKTFTSSVNMNIFSDKNSATFDQFIKSDKDYKTFNFEFDKTTGKDGKMFDFQQVGSAQNQYTPNSQVWTFVRRRSEESIQNDSAPFFSAESGVTWTDDGFKRQ